MTQTATAPAQTPVVRVFRAVSVERTGINVEARTVEFSLSSEQPYERWWGTEILSHDPAAVRLGRLNSGRHPLLVDHDTRDQVGVIEAAWIAPDRTLRVRARFGQSARAQEIWQDVQDGIRSLVSVGYQIHSMVLVSRDDDDETYLVDSWEPFEGSIVAVPADPSVGIGREAFAQQLRRLSHSPVHSPVPSTGVRSMTAEAQTLAPAADSAAASAAAPVPAAARGHDDGASTTAAIRLERQRVADITAAGKKTGRMAEAERAIENGTSYDAFRESVFNALADSGQIRLAEPATIGMSKKEVERFSFCRLLLATMFPGEVGLQKAASFELECSRAAKDARQESRGADRDNGFSVPADMLTAPMGMSREQADQTMRLASRFGRRDLVVGTPSAGGNLVATELLAASFIDLLTNRLAVMGAGATMLPGLSGNIVIPRAVGGATAYWVAESGGPTKSQAAFDQIGMSPKTVGAYSDYSRRLLMQASIAVEAFVRMDIARTLSLEIDRAALAGTAANNQPRGLLSTSGLGSVAGGVNGAAPTWEHIVDLETAIASANADTGTMGYLTNAKVRGKLKKTQMFTGTNGSPVWGTDGTLNGYSARVSNQVPSNLVKGTASNCSAIVFGNWADLLVGLWGGLDMMLDPYTGGTSGTRRVIALQDVDVLVRQPASFAVMLDALTN